MTLSLETCTRTITDHAAKLAERADGAMDRGVRHCPGWTVADVVSHLTEVHWFWAGIVEGLLAEPPRATRATPAANEDVIEVFLSGASHLVEVLAAADQSAEVWTWAPRQRNVAFVTRHQVQEVIVHHFDVANAIGATVDIDADVAVDAVDEFLTFSVSSADDPADPPGAPFEGEVGLWASDAGVGWKIRGGAVPGTLAYFRDDTPSTPALVAPSGSLLLWLYSRVTVEGDALAQKLGARVHELSYTS